MTKQTTKNGLRNLIYSALFLALASVSYTHLDVYKRQVTYMATLYTPRVSDVIVKL